MLRVGDRRFCRCTGTWQSATIERLNDDGSYDVRPDNAVKPFPPTWHGVTRGELVEAPSSEPSTELPLPLYWNQVRMGGRDPSEVARTIVLADALEALGIGEATRRGAIGEMERVEARLDLRVPRDLRVLMTYVGLADAVNNGHPNSPRVLPADAWWVHSGLDGDLLLFMESHQCELAWGVALTPRAPRVFVLPDHGDKVWFTAPHVAFFLWDLCQTGLVWHHAMGAGRDHPLQRTSVGVAPDRRSWWSRLLGT